MTIKEFTPVTPGEMLKEGRELAKIHKNVVVKVPITKEGLKAVKAFSSEGIKTNVTVTFTAPAKPGQHRIYCDQPGHEQAGMVGTLVVEQ